jgi:hypothetical protein
MTIPDRETAQALTWHLDGLLADCGPALPAGLTAALRAYRAELMRHCARQPWARPGQRTRYGTLADAIEHHIADGTWQPRQRMPSTDILQKTYHEKEKAVQTALFILAVRGRLGYEGWAYYVLPAS